MRLACVGVLLLVAGPPFEYNTLNPGATSEPPGPGCQIGTSGCFPSAPPGPVTIPDDTGATEEYPPPSALRTFGNLPGVYVPAPSPPVGEQPVEAPPAE